MIKHRTRCVAGLVLAGLLPAGCDSSRESLIARYSGTINRYCVDCHNDVERVGDLTLESLSLSGVGENREIWEKVVRKLRGGRMPPPDGPRPEHSNYVAFTRWLEAELDRGYEPLLPAPGMHRLNRTEYANAVRDLLALEVDSAQFLPSDDSSRGFDNQAGTLSMSPARLEAYVKAAGKISRLAIGTASAPTQALYRVAEDTTQNYRVEGLPFGTRGGILIDHQFPANGEYHFKIFSVNLGNMGNTRPFGEVRGEKLEVLLDDERLALVDWDEALGVGSRRSDDDDDTGQLRTIDVRVPVTAGSHSVGVTFLATQYAPSLDFNKPFERSTIETGGLPGFTFYPHIGSVRIDGPYGAERPDDTPSRSKIFICTPRGAEEETGCVRRIVTNLARLAYRGMGTEQDIATLMEFYALGRDAGEDFEEGIEMALQRVLADPKFLYRFEEVPPGLAPGELYQISDFELASRLSFFIWSSIPDAELLTLAEQNQLSKPDVLEQQVDRMLEDPRSSALAENFAGQWLALRSLDSHVPVVDRFPDFDDNLRQAFRRETELLFDSLIREDRSVVDLLTADYTFVNDRLAKHYGMPGIQGSRFRRVELGDEFDARRGLLGKGSVLTVASQPGRTSPVKRGNWILTNVFGIPAPDPPPDVPPLEPTETDSAGNTHQPTMREQMERHRDNPACSGCHMIMDPFGFALETFDATGRWRGDDDGNPVDTSAVLYDGTKVSGPVDLREFLLKYSDQFVHNVTEKLLTYALGRGTDYYDMPVVRSIVRDAEPTGYGFNSLVLAVVRSEAFQKNRAPETDEQSLARSALQNREPWINSHRDPQITEVSD